jgi:hypothetical protein
MTDVRAVDPAPRSGASVLIYGAGEAPMAVLASALAFREVGAFRWAEGALSTELPEPAALRVVGVGSGPSEGWRVPTQELLPPTFAEEDLKQWLLPEPPDQALVDRLGAYLRLPSVLQWLVSRAPEPGGRSAIVLTNLDALPVPAVEHALGPEQTHSTLRQEGVTMLVTYRGAPSDSLRRAFDRIYRVEGRADQLWQEALVTRERGEGPDGMAPGRSLGERLPWLGLSGSQAEPPHGIPPHRLR